MCVCACVDVDVDVDVVQYTSGVPKGMVYMEAGGGIV